MTKLYFGYGSNLWKSQMLLRCPTSQYLGLARLNNYRWIINARGYANVVEQKQPETSPDTQTKDEVWGLVYSLQPSDEAQLDVNEGVPEAYTKEDLSVDFWPVGSDGEKPKVQDSDPQSTEMLVYIDRKRVTPDKPKKEYIYRMNMGVKDAVDEGMPTSYVEEVIREFIPDVQDETVVKLAQRQALSFEDEQ